MFDNSTNSIPSQQSELPPPRFDAAARANAQPVLPLSTSRTSHWLQRARSVRGALSSRTRVLALVVIAGFSLGAVGGTLLASQNSRVIEEPVSILEPSAEVSASQIPDVADETMVTPLEVNATEQPSARKRHRRYYRPVRQSDRAFRVAVIR